MHFLKSFVIITFFVCFSSCSAEKTEIAKEFSTPAKTYRFWLETAEKGDFSNNIRCLTEASQRLMDTQLKQMDEFMRRLNANLAVFKSYSVSDQKSRDNRAVVILKGPQRGVIAVPLLMEPDGWKIDMIALFGGAG